MIEDPAGGIVRQCPESGVLAKNWAHRRRNQHKGVAAAGIADQAEIVHMCVTSKAGDDSTGIAPQQSKKGLRIGCFPHRDHPSGTRPALERRITVDGGRDVIEEPYRLLRLLSRGELPL